jgi:hypothetical protein
MLGVCPKFWSYPRDTVCTPLVLVGSEHLAKILPFNGLEEIEVHAHGDFYRRCSCRDIFAMLLPERLITLCVADHVQHLLASDPQCGNGVDAFPLT